MKFIATSYLTNLQTMDLEAMLRHASEFNFQVTAFHHVNSLSIQVYVLTFSGLGCVASAGNDQTWIRYQRAVFIMFQRTLNDA